MDRLTKKAKKRKMREREEIEADVAKAPGRRTDDLAIEVLLDIREVLRKGLNVWVEN